MTILAKLKSKSCYYYVILASFCLSMQAISVASFDLIFPTIVVCSAISVLLLVAQILLFNSEKKLRPVRVLSVQLLAAGVAFFTIIQFGFLVSRGWYANFILNLLGTFAAFVFLLIASILPLLLGADILRKHKGAPRLLGFILIAFSFFVVLFFILGGFSGVSINDATYIAFHAARSTLSGLNPYALNYSGLHTAFENGSINSVTTVSNGQLLGIYVYPPLYLAFSMPFLLLASSIPSLSHVLIVEEAVYMLILLALIAWFGKGIKREHILGLFIIVPFIFFGLISFVDIVVLILLVAAYLSMDRWYFGVLLGLAVATHQLAWPPAILLLAYCLFRSPRKKAALDISTTALTVLAASSYFLLIGPGTYIKNMFLSLYGVIPYGPSPLGFLILRYFPLPLHYFTILFYASLAICAIAYVYLGRRRNLAILSFLPMMFLSVGRPEYYLFYLILGTLLFALDRKADAAKAIKGSKPIAYVAICIISLLALAFALYGHAKYSSDFNVSLSSPALFNSSNSIAYSASFSSGNSSGQLRYFLLVFNPTVEYPIPTWYYSTVTISASNGTSLFSRSAPAGVSNNTFSLPMHLEPAANSIEISSINASGTYAACAIYNTTYFYICPTGGQR